MAYEIIFVEEAKEELGAILYFITYIRMLGRNYSEKVKLKILSEARILSSFPEMCPATGIKDREGHEYRKMVVDKRYIVLYYIDYDDRIVYIAHIYDGRSNYIRKLV